MPVSPATDARPRYSTALLGLLALWLLVTLGVRPLLLPDEGRYAEVARAMLHAGLGRGAWVPTLDGMPFFHKPPLFYWLDVAAMRAFGETAFAGRFGSFVGAWLMGAALLLAMQRRHGPRTATTALAMLATMPFFFIGAQYANHDMLVGGLIAAAVLAFARAVEAPPRVERRWAVAGWALCGLALLSKGLIGIVLPALVVAPWLLAQKRWRQLLGLLHPLGLIAFALVALPWCVSMQLRYPGFFDYFVIEQHFRRFAQTNFNNVHGVWFFLVAMPLLTLPWSAWLPAAIRRARVAISGHDATVGLYVWWLIAIVGFFSIPSSKLVGYALPALAPWCALLALAVAPPSVEASPRRRGQVRTVATLAGRACVAVVIVVAWRAPQSSRALGLALAEGIAPGDRVVMVDEYFYDVPFYAHLDRPVEIASAWDDPELAQHDNWRKEVFDAARFDPAAGRALLRPLAPFAALVCNAGGAVSGSSVWFVAKPDDATRVAALAGAARVMKDQRAELWRVPARRCR